MTRYLLSLLVVAFALTGVSAFAQTPPPHSTLFYNNGIVYIDSSVTVQITGNTITTGPLSVFHNDGAVYVHFDTLFPSAAKGFTLDNDAVVNGNGYYEIEPDWTNNSISFNSGESHVNLMSDVEQLITGTQVSNFNILELRGDGIGTNRKKRMTINVNVYDSLSLNNRELATDSFVLSVQNTESTAISNKTSQNDVGFVSSLHGDTREGSLRRRTANSANPYLFPVGSSVNPPSSAPYIYRPVDLLPDSAHINQFGVRFVNESPDIRGYDQFALDDKLCSVNPNFYHFINRPSGFDQARIRFYYDPLTDGVYDQVAQWSKEQWNLIENTSFNNKNAFFRVIVPEHKFYSQDTLPFILADRIPEESYIVGENDICSNSLAMLRAIGNSNFYNWTVPGGIDILSDPKDDSLIMKVYETGGYVYMSSTSSTKKCVEAADSFLIEVHSGPKAHFTVSDLVAFTNQNLEFRDSTIGTPVEWFWKFGDGSTAFSPIVKHRFRHIGEFPVEMYVQDENGCLDSAYLSIEIIEGISIPNVFTPNGDGRNDFFYIPNSGMKEYHFQVFGRWGNLIFETTAPEIAWDGYNTYGKPVSEGTYFYVLEAIGEKGEYTEKGSLTLLR